MNGLITLTFNFNLSQFQYSNIYEVCNALRTHDIYTTNCQIKQYNLLDVNALKYPQNVYKSNRDGHTHFTRHAHHFHYMKGNNEFIIKKTLFIIYNFCFSMCSHLEQTHPQYKHECIIISLLEASIKGVLIN